MHKLIYGLFELHFRVLFFFFILSRPRVQSFIFPEFASRSSDLSMILRVVLFVVRVCFIYFKPVSIIRPVISISGLS